MPLLTPITNFQKVGPDGGHNHAVSHVGLDTPCDPIDAAMSCYSAAACSRAMPAASRVSDRWLRC